MTTLTDEEQAAPLSPLPVRHAHPYVAREKGATLFPIRDAWGVIKAVRARFPRDRKSRWYTPLAECPEHPGEALGFCWVRGLTDSTGSPMPVSALPLFQTEYLASKAYRGGEKGAPIVLVQGFRAALDLRLQGAAALGTTTGAGGTPGAKALSVCRNRHVILVPAPGEAGKAHMLRVGSLIEGVSATTMWSRPKEDEPWDAAKPWSFEDDRDD